VRFKGNTGDPAQQGIKEQNYIPHVKQRGEEVQEKQDDDPSYMARRWVECGPLLIQSFQKAAGGT